MEQNTFSFESEDGIKLFARSWLPTNSPKGKIILIHGLGEHSGRYSHVGIRFAENGYALSAFDLRGHGRSEGKRGYSPSLEAILEDIGNFIHINLVDGSKIPLFLYGHSLGSVYVLNYSMRRNVKLNGMILSAPSLRNEIENQKLKLTAVKMCGDLFPTLTLPSGLDVQYLSRDENIVKAYVEDPLVHDQASLSFAKYSLDAISYILNFRGEFPYPLLVMHGSADRISFPEGTSEFIENISGNVNYKLWEGYFHELHNEPGNEEVISYIIEWLNKQI